MANCTPKITGAGLGILIEETPACTPVPQASSTVAHRNSDRYCMRNVFCSRPGCIGYDRFLAAPFRLGLSI